jgi:dihydroxy-acid dehydratase
VGGPIALVEDGDAISIDAVAKTITLDLPAQVLEHRRQRWSPPPPPAGPGVLTKYARLVSSASRGAVTTGA